ncbi:hypothetical protein GCM10010102_26100 [Promicromonospora citrea]|uniref:Uncharacterized protein n=1 Tax=Promicromonospora citrea TaxID=43677 RepID=A0A8H9GJW2_9MICO|nr:hypothetical protein GCM10010102_26100 [Promicromonospora citrea]
MRPRSRRARPGPPPRPWPDDAGSKRGYQSPVSLLEEEHHEQDPDRHGAPEDYLGEATTVTHLAVDRWAATPGLDATHPPVAELATRAHHGSTPQTSTRKEPRP